MEDARRHIPGTDTVLGHPRLVAAGQRLNRTTIKAAVLAAQERARAGEIGPEAVADAAADALPPAATSLRPVINATGVVLHTNLGRAALSAAAREALLTASGYADVEFDLASGRRARRGRGTLDALRAVVPAAEATLVVNNGAAAVLLAVTAIAAGREVLVSRGELVEIGDGFRLPELLTTTGVRFREVGTTNRTRVGDYASAAGPDTAAVLKVHPSNFRVSGFTSAASIPELVTLGLPVIADLGSGLLHPDPLLPDEPDVTGALRAGAAVVTASGDKLLGGPQAGLVFGRTDLVESLRRHPLARALRVDKLTLAALEATLRGLDPPTRVALHLDPAQLRERAGELAGRLRDAGIDARVVDSAGVVGGGGAPGLDLPGAGVALPVRYAAPLRTGRPSVVGRVDRGRLVLDLRCVSPADDPVVAAAVRAAAAGCPG